MAVTVSAQRAGYKRNGHAVEDWKKEANALRRPSPAVSTSLVCRRCCEPSTDLPGGQTCMVPPFDAVKQVMMQAFWPNEPTFPPTIAISDCSGQASAPIRGTAGCQSPPGGRSWSWLSWQTGRGGRWLVSYRPNIIARDLQDETSCCCVTKPIREPDSPLGDLAGRYLTLACPSKPWSPCFGRAWSRPRACLAVHQQSYQAQQAGCFPGQWTDEVYLDGSGGGLKKSYPGSKLGLSRALL